jgi:hypothetical protein
MALTEVPLNKLLREALKDCRRALVERGIYEKDHQNLGQAYSGARDFVDFRLEGPEILEKDRR